LLQDKVSKYKEKLNAEALEKAKKMEKKFLKP